MIRTFLIVLTVIITVFISGCTWGDLSFYDFEENHVSTYFEAENKSNNRYVLFYYDSTEEMDRTFIQDTLSFFETFEALDFYFLDTAQIETEISGFGGYENEPIIHVVSSKQPFETYIGETEIRSFLFNYSNIEFEYDLFESQHLSSIEEALQIENDDYIIYYYLDNCPHCIAAKPYFLPWAFTKSVEDIYFINGAEVQSPDNFPNELIILQSGTPLLLLMSNGQFMNEYYENEYNVMEYIERVGDGDIIAKDVTLDYSDFSDVSLSSFDETLTISDNLHIEYYYSPYCAHCNSIKTDVLNFFQHLEGLEYYLINASEATGIPKIDDFTGVPALYIVYQNEVVKSYIGSLEIPEFINDYIQGNIDLSEYQ